MKQISKYAVTNGHMHGQTFRILGVTRISGRQVHGRSRSKFDTDATTHCAERDVLVYLPDEGAARLFVERAEKLKAKYRRAIKEAEAALKFAVMAEQAELRALVQTAQEAADAQR